MTGGRHFVGDAYRMIVLVLMKMMVDAADSDNDDILVFISWLNPGKNQNKATRPRVPLSA